MKLPHLLCGITNDGVESLNLFKEIYDKVVEGWHGFKSEDKHKSDMDYNHLKPFSIDQKTIDKYVKSTRVRAGRSIQGLSLPAFTSAEDRKQVENYLRDAFPTLTGDLKGS